MVKKLEYLKGYIKDLSKLLVETKKYVVPEKKQEFEFRAASTLDNFIEVLSKEANNCSNGGWSKIVGKWHELPAKYKTIKRRYILLNPPSEEDFIASLWWMIEQGGEEDLALIREVKKNPRYSSKDIKILLEMAEQRISERVYGIKHQRNDKIKIIEEAQPIDLKNGREQITIYVSPHVMRKARQIAKQTHRRIDNVLADLLEQTITEVPIEALSDEEVLELTELQLPEEQQKTLSNLLEQNREETLDAEGRRQLGELMQSYEQGLLRKSQALRAAVKRGLIEPLQQ